MPSDRPPAEPPNLGSDLAGRRRQTRAVGDGTLVFALVLAAFVAYALGSETTYRATAVVGVEPTVPIELPTPSEAAERLRRAALDPSIVAKLAAEEKPSPPTTLAQVGARISNALSVETTNGRSFTFVATATRAERAQRVVNELAEQAARRAAQIFDQEPQAEIDPAARAKAELLDFLAAHPGVASEPSPAPTRTGPDPLVLALRAERLRIEQKLAGPPAVPSDNPYEDPTSLEKPDFLKRRLREIDNALEARAKPKPSAARAANEPTPEVRAEWHRLLRAVSETRSADTARAPSPRLKVTLARAALPQVPIKPNRPRLVLLGVILASVAGVFAGLIRAVVEARAARRYGIKTGSYPVAPLPQTTLRISHADVPRPNTSATNALATPVPTAPAKLGPITPIPPAPIAPNRITPIPPAVAAEITPIPRPPLAPAPITPIPAAPVATVGITQSAPDPAANAPATPIPEPTPTTPLPPAVPALTLSLSPATPIPPGGVAPPATATVAASPIVIEGPTARVELDGPPTTQAYGGAEPAGAARKTGRRTTKIYGTPPPPELEESAKALRTTQAYGSPPAALAPKRDSHIPSPTPIPAEVLPPEKRSSLKPAPMIPLASSSIPPAVAPSTRSGSPLAETGYSYVQTPIPPAHSIPQTPLPRRPSPPPNTEPYGSIPPVQPKRSASDPPFADPNRLKTPLPKEREVPEPAPIVRAHPVPSGWTPEKKLAPGLRRDIAGELLTLAVDRCQIIGVTGVRGLGSEKSRAAVEIAFALSEARHPRILLAEGDFHFPQIQTWLKLDVPLAAGFSQQLRSRVQGSKDRHWHVVECSIALHVLAEGVMRSPGLLLSKQFEQAMRDLRSYYDVIILDAPVAPGEADGQALADVVDGVVVVGPPARSGEIVEIAKIFASKFQRVLEP
jgi:Mrp family chromosome partitioning ATPase